MKPCKVKDSISPVSGAQHKVEHHNRTKRLGNTSWHSGRIHFMDDDTTITPHHNLPLMSDVHFNSITLFDVSLQQTLREGILKEIVDSTSQRSSTIRGVPTLIQQLILELLSHDKIDAHHLQTLVHIH
mmetsp:Transcript_69472/g.122630  ORF Transcript_69472/g.122630 Transcript_69472/m.122630 type:complete len:128 (-) Transcript_69472:3019-3402(-)